jgi:formamidopyrimidine-DNA glycosylase
MPLPHNWNRMPELPDVEVYVEALRERIIPHRLKHLGIYSPFLLRPASPPVEAAQGRSAEAVRRLGKRIAIGLEGDLWLVVHLMTGPAALAGFASQARHQRFAVDFHVRFRSPYTHRSWIAASRFAPCGGWGQRRIRPNDRAKGVRAVVAVIRHSAV